VDYSTGSTNGDLYAVWQTHQSFTVRGNPVDDAVMLSRSTDGGHTWSAPVKVNHTPPDAYNPQAFTPSVHVASNGDVAVTYYDFRNDVEGGPLSTDYWVAHCHAATTDCSQESGWPDSQENRLTPGGSFDMRTAPYAIGYFLGDYEGLDNFGTTFTPFFVQAHGTIDTPNTDAYYSTAGAPTPVPAASVSAQGNP